MARDRVDKPATLWIDGDDPLVKLASIRGFAHASIAIDFGALEHVHQFMNAFEIRHLLPHGIGSGVDSKTTMSGGHDSSFTGGGTVPGEGRTRKMDVSSVRRSSLNA
ncbi:MAG: hypothetical protein AAGF12_13400 [Myxococcota bacterium]